MSDLGAEKARNREVAQNAQHREVVSAIRVSGLAISITLVIAAIVIGIVWAWTHR